MLGGIEIKDGIIGYLICGVLFGSGMLVVVPLIRFFTLPVKFITLFMISVMLAIIIFFLFNFGLRFVDFKDGGLMGFDNSYISLPEIDFGMTGNVLLGGFLCGTISSGVKALEKGGGE
jgi:hypothetical protein